LHEVPQTVNAKTFGQTDHALRTDRFVDGSITAVAAAEGRLLAVYTARYEGRDREYSPPSRLRYLVGITMRTLSRRSLLASVSAAITLNAAEKKHIVFVLGDHEYSGEATMPLLAAELEKRYGVRTTLLKSHPDQNAEENLPGMEALAQADLAVFFLRWRRLPKDQVANIDRYVRSGRPLVGIRTTSHSFNYPQDHELVRWNAWASEAFGAPPGWGRDGHTHYGHESSTDVRIVPENADHPVLTGINGPFHVRSWLYHVVPKWPPADAETLLIGTAVNPNKAAVENPVAWTWKNRYGGRVFFTTLGHPEDFAIEPVQRLFLNSVQWALDEKAKPKWHGPIEIHVPYRGIVKTSEIQKAWPVGQPKPK
jgi:type 1 glutamine amidotransferase